MNPQQTETLKDATANLEAALGKMEIVMDSTESAALGKAAAALVQVLSHIYDMDPEWLSRENRERLETLAEKARAKRGRDSFNTGF